MPPLVSGTITSEEGLQRPGAEIQRGLHQRIVDAGQRGVDRQHHKRQIGIHDTDVHRRVGVQDLQRLIDNP